MPTYEYSCKDCGQHLEVVQSFTDDPITECPNCHGDLRKVFHPIGISFKGSGFYKTDSRSGSATKTTDKPDDKAAKADDKSEKSDSKADGKSDGKSDSKKSDSTSSSDSSKSTAAKSA